MARHAGRVIGIEIVPQAVEGAWRNARRNQIANAEFHTAAVETLLPRLVKNGLRPDVIVLDPPRKGASPEALAAIVQLAPARVVMVSCNPATLARDLAFLFENGYQVEKVQPVDLFPRTRHVECVVLLSKTPGKEAENPVVQEAPL